MLIQSVHHKAGGLPQFVAEVAGQDHAVHVEIDAQVLIHVQRERKPQPVRAALLNGRRTARTTAGSGTGGGGRGRPAFDDGQRVNDVANAFGHLATASITHLQHTPAIKQSEHDTADTSNTD